MLGHPNPEEPDYVLPESECGFWVDIPPLFTIHTFRPFGYMDTIWVHVFPYPFVHSVDPIAQLEMYAKDLPTAEEVYDKDLLAEALGKL